ncbi:MAG: acyltransferase family protein [Betaproteobacteria bacterium]
MRGEVGIGEATTAQGERRYYGLDALRGGMMMLGIVLHASEMYLAAPPPTFPLPTDRNSSLAFDLLFHFIHQFRMPTFFVLAGFFAALLVEKRGLWGTYKNRAARVLAPLAAALITILPLTMVLGADFALAARYGVHDWLPDGKLIARLQREIAAAGHPDRGPAALHLWFLLYLLYFYLLLPVCRWLAAAALRRQRVVSAALESPALVFALGLYAALTLWPYQGGQVLEGFLFFRPHVPSLLYYGSFFVLGYLLRGFPALFETAARRVWRYGLLAAALFPLALWASHLEYAAGRAPSASVHLAAVVANGLATWALVYFFIGCAQRFFDRDTTWILYASQSSYWVFLVHMPLVLLAGWWLTPYDLPAEIKFLAVVSFVSVVCLLSYHYLVQRSWMSVFLNGRRFDLPWPWR